MERGFSQSTIAIGKADEKTDLYIAFSNMISDICILILLPKARKILSLYPSFSAIPIAIVDSENQRSIKAFKWYIK